MSYCVPQLLEKLARKNVYWGPRPLAPFYQNACATDHDVG
jgi:hypothetical protein